MGMLMYALLQSQFVTSLPAGLVRNVFGDAATRGILLFLARMEAPWRYSAVREELDVHPQKFQRSLERLEHHALVGRIPDGPPDAAGRRVTLLEPTALGRFWAEQWSAFQEQVERAAEARGFPQGSVEV